MHDVAEREGEEDPASRASAWSLVKNRIRAVASSSPKPAATEVFLASAISTLASGGTDRAQGLRQDDVPHRLAER